MFQGRGDRLAPPNPAALFFAQPLTRRQRHRLARHGQTRLTISTSQGGTIVVRVRIGTGRHARTIQTTRRTLKRASTIHSSIRLTNAARHQLATHHRLRLTITVGYSQTSNVQRLRATLTDA